jgi:GGDEF domain-containing protein
MFGWNFPTGARHNSTHIHAGTLARVESVRERLKFERSDGPPIKFSVGHASLPVDGDAEAALREADEAMYRQKGAGGGRLRTV